VLSKFMLPQANEYIIGETIVLYDSKEKTVCDPHWSIVSIDVVFTVPFTTISLHRNSESVEFVRLILEYGKYTIIYREIKSGVYYFKIIFWEGGCFLSEFV